MHWYRQFVAFFISLLLVSTFVAALHHHESASDDHDCPICLVSHQQAASQAAVAFDGVPFITETAYSTPTPGIAEQTFVFLLSNRAPPA